MPIVAYYEPLRIGLVPIIAGTPEVSVASRLLEILFIACAVAAWLSRLPYIVGRTRLGRVLATVPDRTGPQVTITAGVIMTAAGLLLLSGKAANFAWAPRPYLGISLILLGVSLGLNFLFPTQIGSRGILDSYGGLSTWDNIESYAWSSDGGLLELQLRQSIFLRRRFLAIPERLRRDVDAYMTHRLWGTAGAPAVAGRRVAPQPVPPHSFDHGSYNSTSDPITER